MDVPALATEPEPTILFLTGLTGRVRGRSSGAPVLFQDSSALSDQVDLNFGSDSPDLECDIKE